MPKSKYEMSISLNVLNHLGLNLYSNTPAVLAEVIANAWDADATEVKINFSKHAITVADNGVGMDLDDINKKYLLVGYEKRPKIKKGEKPMLTPLKGRPPMGRKGIGKLSLFSIANKISVYSRKAGGEGESFLMDAHKIKAVIEGEPESGGKKTKKVNPSDIKSYEPEEIPFEGAIDGNGTLIKITEFKKSVRAVKGLRKRIARRFGVIGEEHGFAVLLNNEKITYADRDYFDKARFLFQYGEDYSEPCVKLEKDDSGAKIYECRKCHFDKKGNANSGGPHKISGWIAMAHHSNDLDDKGADDDNLNKITLVVRGKVAQEDILQEHRIGGLFTKFIYGEINADFLDEDGKDDIATSSRQRINEDDERYKALMAFIRDELDYIWKETNKLKDKKGPETAFKANPFIKEWYDGLRPKALKTNARKLLGAIGRVDVDEVYKKDLYVNGIMGFEQLKMTAALDEFAKMADTDASILLSVVSDMDAIEAARYGEIVHDRLRVVDILQAKVEANEKEKALQQYIFNHLWLLSPAWERATSSSRMDKVISETADAEMEKVVRSSGEQGEVIISRPDIRYRMVPGGHVIVELKRASEIATKREVETQLNKYINAVQEKLDNMNDGDPIYGVCLVGQPLRGWKNNPRQKEKDMESLKAYGISVVTYDELIDKARDSYKEYLEQSVEIERLRQLLDNIRTYDPQKGGA